MTLQTRLVVSFSILLLVVIAAVGLVATQSVERVLIDQIDKRTVAVRGSRPSTKSSARLQTAYRRGVSATGWGDIHRRQRIDGRSETFWIH